MGLVASMEAKGVAPNAFALTAAASACVSGGQWAKALAFLARGSVSGGDDGRGERTGSGGNSGGGYVGVGVGGARLSAVSLGVAMRAWAASDAGDRHERVLALLDAAMRGTAGAWSGGGGGGQEGEGVGGEEGGEGASFAEPLAFPSEWDPTIDLEGGVAIEGVGGGDGGGDGLGDGGADERGWYASSASVGGGRSSRGGRGGSWSHGSGGGGGGGKDSAWGRSASGEQGSLGGPDAACFRLGLGSCAALGRPDLAFGLLDCMLASGEGRARTQWW